MTSGPPRHLTHARSRPFRANIDCYSTRRALAWSGLVPEPSSSRAIVTSRPPTSSLRPYPALLLPPSAARLSPRQTYASSQLPPSHARPAMIASSASHASSNVSTQPIFMRRTWLTPPTPTPNIHAYPVEAEDPQVVNLRLEHFARGLVGRGAPLHRAGLGETRAVARVQFLRRERERERDGAGSRSRVPPPFQNSNACPRVESRVRMSIRP